MKRTWKKVLAFVCAFTLVAVPVTYNIVNADGSDSASIARFLGASDASSSSAAAEDAATEEEYFEDASTGTEYMLTIPSTLTVKNSGWNEIEGGIAATGTLEAGKKLVVTAESENSWALKSGDNSVGYNLAADGNSESVYNKESNPASWEFESLSSGTAATKTAGIIVEDYSKKPAGDYEDVVTFTASLADVPVTGVSLDKTTATFKIGESVDLTATVTPDNAANKTVTWKSSNEAVAKVDGNGKVTGVSEGTATITATVGDKSTECSVTVEAALGVTWNYATFSAMKSGDTKNGITFTTNAKKISGNLYSGTHTFTVNGKKIKSIEFATTSTNMSSSSFSSGSATVENYTFDSTQDGYSVAGKKITWTGDAESVSMNGNAYAIEYVIITVE